MEAQADYHTRVRDDVFALIDGPCGRLLDFGGGVGATSAALLDEGMADHAVLFDQVAKGARPQIAEAYAIDLNDTAMLAQQLAKTGPFDTILCLDILEHLYDPWAVMGVLHQAMTPGAQMIISLPNVNHYSLTMPLIFKDEWEYRDAGILDRTHIRWFTRKGAIRLAQSSGLVVAAQQTNISGRKWQWANRLTLRLFSRFFVLQYQMRMRRSD